MITAILILTVVSLVSAYIIIADHSKEWALYIFLVATMLVITMSYIAMN